MKKHFAHKRCPGPVVEFGGYGCFTVEVGGRILDTMKAKIDRMSTGIF
jgi:hypothetical protein